ncbi:hypothetical protein JCM8547_008962 [Rhodosporidiobolus lusitaniae]
MRTTFFSSSFLLVAFGTAAHAERHHGYRHWGSRWSSLGSLSDEATSITIEAASATSTLVEKVVSTVDSAPASTAVKASSTVTVASSSALAVASTSQKVAAAAATAGSTASSSYNTVVAVDFSDFASSGQTVDAFLTEKGFRIIDGETTYREPYSVDFHAECAFFFFHLAHSARLHFEALPVPSATNKIDPSFRCSNVDIVDGSLRLKVDGWSSGNVRSADVESHATPIYGTYTVVAKLTAVPGVCQGFFSYHSGNSEIDLELLSSYYQTGYGYSVQPGVYHIDQPLVSGEQSTYKVTPYGMDPSADYHTYTLAWSSDKTDFYLDGELKSTLTENVPSSPAAFVLNAWSSGDPNWSAGPPAEDSYTLIKSIKLEFDS